MIYRFRHRDISLEFRYNTGRAELRASDPVSARARLKQAFPHTRDEEVIPLGGGRYVIAFKVSLQYNLSRRHDVERSLKVGWSRRGYDGAKYVIRYITAVFCRECGRPEWLAESDVDLDREIRTLRRAAVVSREASGLRDFAEWDIAIYNYLELNSKVGHRSRVVRNRKKIVGNPNDL